MDFISKIVERFIHSGMCVQKSVRRKELLFFAISRPTSIISRDSIVKATDLHPPNLDSTPTGTYMSH